MKTKKIITSMASEVGMSNADFANALNAGRVYMDRCGNLKVKNPLSVTIPPRDRAVRFSGPNVPPNRTIP